MRGVPEETVIHLPRWWSWAGLALLLGLLAVLTGGALSTQKLLVWGISHIGQKVLAAMPPTAPIEKRQALRVTIECVARAAQERRLSDEEIAEFGKACSRALRDGLVTPVELDRVLTVGSGLCERANVTGSAR